MHLTESRALHQHLQIPLSYHNSRSQDTKAMQFEDLLDEIGSFGLYQRVLSLTLIPLTTGLVGFTYYTQLLMLAAPPHTCNQGGGGAEGVAEEAYHHRLIQLLNTTPYNDEARKPYSCHEHELNTTWLDPSLTWPDLTNVTSLTQIPTPKAECRSGWTYDYEVFFSTFTSEHDWVCGEAWKPYLVVTIFWVGNTVGSWLWGVVSDMYGRRVGVVGCMVVYGVSSVASVFVTNFYGFTILRFLTGSSHHTFTHLPFVLILEYCGRESRVLPLLIAMASYTLSSLAAPALAWAIWSWPALTLISAIPCLLLPLSAKWLPESASWLITRGRFEDAKRQLEIVAKVNGRRLPADILAKLTDKREDKEAETTVYEDNGYNDQGVTQEETTEGASNGVKRAKEKVSGKETAAIEGTHKNLIQKDDVRVKGKGNKQKDSNKSGQSIVQAVRYPGLRRNILLVLIVWMLACMCYYGHCQNTSNLGSSILVSYLLGSAVEIPSWCVPWLIHRFGRKLPLFISFIVSAMAGFVYAVVPQEIEWLVLTAGLVGRASITGSYYIALQYGPEIFPTVVRGQGQALAETLGGVAIFLSPLIVYLGEHQRTLPLLVFAGLSVVGGSCTVLLPETGGAALPQTLPQAEMFAIRAAPRCFRSKSSMTKMEAEGDIVVESKV